MRCPSCGFENVSGTKFCGECGAPLKLKCSSCGFANAPGIKFCGECGKPLAEAAKESTPREPRSYTPKHLADRILADEARGEPEGERKTVTALFADIKGSMELIEDLDPEAARAIVDPALKIMMDAVHRYDGYVAQSTGDGIFALFGAPVAHEDHPQRALYAALRMQEEIRRYSDRLRADGRQPFQARVGANTGEVVMRSVSTGEHVEYVPVGHSTSLAARMQALAPVGSIAITRATQKLVEGYFQLKALGPARVKGVSEPVEVYEVTGLGPLRTRLQRSASRGLTKFVGRSREMEAMKAAAEQAKSGRGQIVAAMAEAGTGKSRLFFEFKAVSRSGWMVLETFSVSHGKASAYLPVIDLLHSYFKIAGEDDSRTRREKVNGKVLTLDRSLEDAIPHLFALLGIAEGIDPLAQMDPQIRKRRTLDTIKRLLLRESLNQPLMVIFEDLHWIDEETQAFLNLLADSIGNAKILLLVNYRAEYSHQWNSKTYYTQLRLDPLGKESADEMLTALLGDGADVAQLKRVIIEKTEGNPFFMEEIVQILFDDGALARNGTVRLTRSLGQLKIPPTVQAILASRMDRLPPDEKELLQALAVIGRRFRFGLLRRVVAKSEEELNRMLMDLQLGEFIYEQPAFPDPEYAFKHALTQEVAYNSILVERRKVIHERAAEAIEGLYAERMEDHVGELAHHYGRSANAPKAIDYLWRAAGQASLRSAYVEAINYATAALGFVPALPDQRQRAQEELKLQVTLGASMMATRGFAAPELHATYSRASELARELGDNTLLFAVLQGLWSSHYTRGNAREARAIAEESMALAERIGDPSLFQDAHRALGASLAQSGEFVAARNHLESGLALANVRRPTLGAIRFGPNAEVVSLTRLADVLFDLGYPDQALARATEAVALVEDGSDPFSLAMAMLQLAQTRCSRREPREGEEIARALLALSIEHGFPFWRALATRLIGWALTQQAREQEGIAMVDEQLTTVPDDLMSRYNILLTVAGAYKQLGHPQRGLDTLKKWSDVRSGLGVTGYDGQYLRLRGELLAMAGDEKAAVVSLREALAIARRNDARMHELRAAKSLASLLNKQGRRDEARTMLAQIYGWFTEGFDTADLKDAKALLEELR
jgi:class 3 adenylate cyclase/tetratricopeptide (TPR) repeat protein